MDITDRMSMVDGAMLTADLGPTAVVVGEPLYGGAFRCEGAAPQRFVLPGERVIPGQMPSLLAVSARRVAPECVHFRSCGGCHYQHAEYGLQLELKQQILTGLLAAAGVQTPPPVVHTAQPWGYRNRVRMRVEGEDGRYRVGYSRPGSNVFLPITMCPIAAPLLWRAAEALTASGEDAVSRVWLSAAVEVELFCLADESRLQMTLWLRAADPALRRDGAFAAFCEGLREVVPELVGAGAMLHSELSRRERRAWDGATWGAGGLTYAAAGETYWVNRGAFFQVNRVLVNRLVELVCGGESGELAWDLYAGVGLFTKALARRFARVVAVEGGAEAVASLLAASRSGREFQAVQAATLEFLRARVLERERPDWIVLDPPRAGVGVEGAELLARVAAARLVYVSCDPETLARDLKVITREAYRVESVAMIDLFPQTYHLETVVHLARRD